MYCANCGKEIGPRTNFCPACGTQITAKAEVPYQQATHAAQAGPSSGSDFSESGPANSWSKATVKLLRPRSPRMLGGVCAAFALHYGWNLDVVRILTAILGLFYGIGILAYIACWIIIPEAQHALPLVSR